ncbi:MAG: hypothetical protein RLZZ69_2938, partial [Cyanobacteriota bacterium]
MAKSVEQLVRQISGSSGKEQIGYSPTNRQLGSGGARGFAAKNQLVEYTHVAMSDAIGKRLESGNMIREDLVTLIHEIRHAMQNEIERTGGQIEYLLDPKSDTERALVSKVSNLYEDDPRTQAREIDANIFAERTVDVIADNLSLSFVDLGTAIGATKDVLKQLRAEYFEHKKALDGMDMSDPGYEKQTLLFDDAKKRVAGAFMDMGVDLNGNPTATRPMINGKIDGQDEVSSDLAENQEPLEEAEQAMDSLSASLVRAMRNMEDVADQMAERSSAEGVGSPRQRTRQLSDEEKAVKAEATRKKEAAKAQFTQQSEQIDVGLSFATDLAQTISPNIAEGLDMFADLYRQISSADQSVDELVDSMKNISAPTMFVGAIAGLGRIASTVAPVADSFQRLENILSTTSKIKFESVKSSLMEMSRTLGTDLAASAEQFGQFASSLEGSALEGQATSIFESVTKYSAALGMSTDSQNRSFTALTQIASKNKVQMEELQGQLAESLPGAVNKAAKALGITKAEMYDMMKAGELTATEFLPALARELENSAEAMAGFNAAPMSQQLQILKGQLTTGFVDLLLPIFDGFQGILQSVIQFSSATGAMGVVALTTFTTLITVLLKSALGLQQNVALTTVLSKALTVLRGFLVTTVAPMVALSAAIAVGMTTLQAFNGELSKTSEVKSFKSLNETLEKTLEKLDELREKAKPNSLELPINLNGIQTNTKRIEELKEEYEELNIAQKVGSGLSAAASKIGRFVTGKENVNYFDDGFKNEAQGDFASKTLEKEKEARDQAMKSVQNMIGAYDELLGLSNGLVSNEMEAYKNAQAKESSLNRQENYYKSIASAASAIEMGDGSDPEKLAEIKTTLEAINNNNKGQGFDL